MKEQTKIALTSEFLYRLKNARGKKYLLLEFLRQQNASLLRLVGDYYYSSRGKVHELNVGEEIIFINDLSGSFTVCFNVNFTNGCQDLTYDHEDQLMVMKFLLDVEHSVIHVSGEDVPEREPDEF